MRLRPPYTHPVIPIALAAVGGREATIGGNLSNQRLLHSKPMLETVDYFCIIIVTIPVENQ